MGAHRAVDGRTCCMGVGGGGMLHAEVEDPLHAVGGFLDAKGRRPAACVC